ncbi:efflux RND transporter periplasmic adaptor subunit [Salegentibacter sp. Hel_I_6]|uniref:efflux RND transporter periplasmic adaptor subunit n=1 Tax=Salegentibacter sp. Hel_I_6 TaxID=1250278 RepID=UPI000689BA1E|nr:efflux RND transporter periplasmic adaptor subunit [Salegentibacter sp. Hel_I_6]
MKKIIIAIIIISCFNCTDIEKDNSQIIDKEQYVPEKNEVEIKVLQPQLFKKEILSNGKLVANQKTLMKFRVNGSLQSLAVENGDLVQKGQVLAELDPFEYQQALSNAEIGYKKAHLEFEDMLVGRGYDLSNRDSIPNNIYEMASIRSGYLQAKNQLENASADLEATRLRAPFTGKVADIQFKQYEQVSSGSRVLTLIDDRVFEVEFFLLESEVDQVSEGENVEILAFDSEQAYQGKINSINPIVEKNGMVKIKAQIKNDGKLLEGMNVKVRIQKAISDKLVVPKSAVILRQNQEVLFKYFSGKAFWTYVQTTGENSTSYSVVAHPDKSSASLKAGDTVIVTDNLNLAHDSEVEIKQKN